jgi:hypothetical protein
MKAKKFINAMRQSILNTFLVLLLKKITSALQFFIKFNSTLRGRIVGNIVLFESIAFSSTLQVCKEKCSIKVCIVLCSLTWNTRCSDALKETTPPFGTHIWDQPDSSIA